MKTLIGSKFLGSSVIVLAVMMAAALLVSCDSDSSSDSSGVPTNSAQYVMTFNATWSEATNPADDFPSDPHFSGLIGAAVNPGVSFWGNGDLASTGIKNMAERGSKDPLRAEIQNLINAGLACALISGGGTDSPGSVSVTFTVTPECPEVSIVSMVAPSPDWFVGVSSVRLADGKNWVASRVIELYPYDAGTDSGTTFEAPNQPTTPPVLIRKIDGFGKVGTFTFTRL